MNFHDLLDKRVIIFDGAMGTNLAAARASIAKDVRDKLSCGEAYNLHAPEAVRAVHQSFIDAGCDVIETNTFNANRVALAEHGLEEKVSEIVSAAVSIARDAAGSAKRPVFVSGGIGPTGRLPSMGQVSFDELYDAYLEEACELVRCGVDLIQIDTCQDILQAKAAVIASKDAFEKCGKILPIILTVTIDASGRMLLGSEPGSLIATFVPLGVTALGLNCGFGPDGMEETVRYLAHHSPIPVAVLPNAGLPEIKNGETFYNLGAGEFAERLEYFARRLGVEIVGGCCGTTAGHLKEVVKRLGGKKAKKRDVRRVPSLSSLFESVAIRQRPAPLIIGERMNINGSKAFKDAILSGDFDGAALMARGQESTGAHVIDVSVAYAGRDERSDFKDVLSRLVCKTILPVCIDSTNLEAIHAALKLLPGRSIINSINLEDGGAKARKVLELAKKYGAALIALTIDESGMAKDAGCKVQVAGKLIQLCAEYGIGEADIFIDPLTFTLAEPRAASFGSGRETLEAIKKIKRKHPSVNTVLGVSNISYGFNKDARKVINSVFLNEAVKAGLDAAIVHAGQIVPLSSLDKEALRVSMNLIWNKKGDVLDSFIRFFEGKKLFYSETPADVAPDEGVRLSIIRGDKVGIKVFLDQLLHTMPPEEILNNILLPAMKEVGTMFDKGDIPLPFVLGSAEAMKVATDALAPHFGAKEMAKRGKIILATVRGDVHDIGKNLVDIILSNNGFQVINIGVKQPVENIFRAAVENRADVIGLSGLLVESSLIMKDDLVSLRQRKMDIPVICGGAALTRKYVEGELAKAYGNPVYYAADAFDGLKIVERLLNL